MRIVITAFEASANAGTEAGLAWQWGRAYASRGFTVDVLAQASESNVTERALWAAEGVRFHPLGSPSNTRAPYSALDYARSHFAINRWRRSVRRWFSEQNEHVDFVHHVSWGSVRLVPGFYGSGIEKRVWGPLGGGHHGIYRGLSPRAIPVELLRSLSFVTARHNLRRAARHNELPTLFLATNDETRQFIQDVLPGSPVQMMLADGVARARTAERPREAPSDSPSLLWLGRMVRSKRPDIPIRLAAALTARGLSPRLRMVGDGPERGQLVALATELGIADRISFPGRVPWQATTSLYDQSDLLVFSSMRDSSAPTVVEAASRGVPTVALRVQGLGSLIPPSVAPGPTRYTDDSELIDHMTTTAEKLLEPENYAAASSAALDFAREVAWDLKVGAVLANLRLTTT